MPLSASFSGRLGLLLSLYICQGLPTGVFTQALPALLRQYGVSLTIIGFSGLLALPWALKFLWAPYVDRYFCARLGPRRSWILPLQLASILALLAIAGFAPERLNTAAGVREFFLLMLLVNLFAATQDIATDGLAVRLLTFQERGLGNGVQVAGYRLGLIVGGGFLLYAIAIWSWSHSFMALALLQAVLTLPLWFYREPVARPAPKNRVAPWAVWRSFFSRPGLGGWLLVLVTYKAGESLGSAMVKPMLKDMGLSLADIGLLVSLVGSLAALLGALAGGWLTTRLGRLPAIIGFGLLQALSVAAYALLSWRHGMGLAVPIELVSAINALEHFASGMAMAALLTAVMDLSRPEHAGADFTVQVSVLAIFGGAFYLLAGITAETLGYTAYFLLSGGLALCMLWPAAYWGRRLPVLQAAAGTGAKTEAKAGV